MPWPKGKPRKKQAEQVPAVEDTALKRLQGMVGEVAAKEIARLNAKVSELQSALDQIRIIAISGARPLLSVPQPQIQTKPSDVEPPAADLNPADNLGEGRWA